jgi:two-component system, OmpR family, phosphate regulon sensor histidine kinase PhoR
MFLLTLIGGMVFACITVVIIYRGFNAAIRQAQASIIASLPTPILEVDNHEMIVTSNKAAQKLLGINPQNMVNKKIDDVFKLLINNIPVPYSSYKQSSQADAPVKHLLYYKTPQGYAKQFFVSISPLDPKHPLGDALVTIHDRSNEQQLEEMKVDFVSMAAHELRTPLTAIRGYTSLLQMHYASKLEDAAKELLTRLLVSTNNLTNLIDNLLSVSRIERNDMIIDTKPLNLGLVIKDIYQSFQQQAQTRHQTFTLHAGEDLPLVLADPFRIGQVMINLISNAINYTPEGGTITLTVMNQSDALVVSIKDTGEGIPKEAMPRLFTKFFRVSGSLEQGSKGTGLGLYITKSIVELHKGKIWAESTVGKGSTFTFSLPHANEKDIEYHNNIMTNKNFLTVKNSPGIIVKKTDQPSPAIKQPEVQKSV